MKNQPDVTLTWDEPVVFEAWGTIEHGAHLISTKENCLKMKGQGLLEEEDVPLFSIRGTSWTEVMTIYNEVNGWAPYVPMESE